MAAAAEILVVSKIEDTKKGKKQMGKTKSKVKKKKRRLEQKAIANGTYKKK